MKKEDIALGKISNEIRKLCIELAYAKNPKATHLGGALSSIDILVNLYFSAMRYDIINPLDPNRDRFFLSKGHSILGYYNILCEIGYFTDKILYTYGENGTELPGHPVRNKRIGIEFTNGSLGMGLGVAIGHAIAAKRRNLNYQTYVLMGDGECNEGSVWEGLLAAPHFGLNNLTVIVDKNGYQQTGSSNDILQNSNLSEKFNSFGWATLEVNGHSHGELSKAFCAKTQSQPKIIVANTIKGKGFSFTEGNNSWHHAILTKDQYTKALQELGNIYD
jgi:transketolase